SLPGVDLTKSREIMTVKSASTSLDRRKLLVSGSAIAASAPFAIAMAMQDASPQASPSASPQVTPATPTPPPPTPTPEPVPDHAINIVRGRATWGEPEPGGELRLYI